MYLIWRLSSSDATLLSLQSLCQNNPMFLLCSHNAHQTACIVMAAISQVI